MKLIAQITLASVLGFALAGCGASGTKANLADKFSDDFGTFKKNVKRLLLMAYGAIPITKNLCNPI